MRIPFFLGLGAGGVTDLEKLSGAGTSVPAPPPAREGEQPEDSGGEASLPPGKEGTREPHYPDSDNDQRTLLLMLLQIQQHAPVWMQQHDLHSNVLLVLLALRKSGLASTFERLVTWLSYGSVAVVLDWMVDLHRQSALSLRSTENEIPPDGPLNLLVATAARALHRILRLKADSLEAGYRFEWSPARRAAPDTTASEESVVPREVLEGDCAVEIREDLEASGQHPGDYPVSFALPSNFCKECEGSSCAGMYTSRDESRKQTAQFCVTCLHGGFRGGELAQNELDAASSVPAGECCSGSCRQVL